MLKHIVPIDQNSFSLIDTNIDSIVKLVPNSKIKTDINVDFSYSVVLYASDEEHMSLLKRFLSHLSCWIAEHKTLDSASVETVWNLMKKSDTKKVSTIIRKHQSNEPIKPRTSGQGKYVHTIDTKLITFGIGAAGTGKSYLAVAMACRALKKHEVEKIILTRPVVEAGENLGFLPGDLKEKIDPYMQPLYDALYDILGKPETEAAIAKDIIRIAPLAYMRGCTFVNSFVVLDEAQNATHEQLKMFLTRFGEGSKMIVECDPSQIDLPSKRLSCIQDIPLFKTVSDIGICHFSNDDIVRHPVIKDILAAYETK